MPVLFLRQLLSGTESPLVEVVGAGHCCVLYSLDGRDEIPETLVGGAYPPVGALHGEKDDFTLDKPGVYSAEVFETGAGGAPKE